VLKAVVPGSETPKATVLPNEIGVCTVSPVPNVVEILNKPLSSCMFLSISVIAEPN